MRFRDLLIHARTVPGVVLLLALSVATTRADAPPELVLEQLARGLRQPVDFTHDGTPRRFIVEQVGTIRLIDGDVLEKQPYLDLVARVHSGGECGLLGIAFHPNFKENGFLYANYTAKRPNLQTVIARFKVDPAAKSGDPDTERVLLTVDQPYSNHNGGQLKFGPDGFLYIGLGDGGSLDDPHGNGQRTDKLLGKILRIDVDAPGGYASPVDNPFFGQQGYRSEIWALGLRNPWRFSFDRVTGDLYAGDLGHSQFEEIDLITKGGNYGWRAREATHPFQGGAKLPRFIDPIHEYGRDKGQSVTGGYVYRGKSIPALVGWYVYADYASGRFFALRQIDGKVTDAAEITTTYKDVAGKERPTLNRVQPSSFGEDADGELYVCDHNGVVYRMTGKQ